MLKIISNKDAVYKFMEPVCKIYKVWLTIALFSSSFYVPYIFIMAIFGLPRIYIEYSFAIFIIAIYLSNIKKPEFIKKAIYTLARMVKIFGSIFVLLVIFNAYLKISDILYKFYSLFWKFFETAINTLVISEALVVAIPLLFFGVLGWIVAFKIKRILKAVLLVIVLLLFIYWYSNNEDISKLLLPFFGFSLFLLHANYLWGEVRQFLTSKNKKIAK